MNELFNRMRKMTRDMNVVIVTATQPRRPYTGYVEPAFKSPVVVVDYLGIISK